MQLAESNPQFEENGQLYGKNYDGDVMVHIGNDIYCRRNVMEMAMGSSHRATHVARKLIEGVFRRESVLHLTLSGLPARAQGKQRQNVRVFMMNLTARNAIVDYAQKLSRRRKWIYQSTLEVESF